MADSILYLTDDQAAALAPDPAVAITLMAAALRAIAAGEASLAHHVVHPRPAIGLSAIIGVVRGTIDLAGQKWVSEAPAGGGVSALVTMNDPATGAIQAIMGARALTGLRTAAVSGACIQALGRDGEAAIVGTGLQCRAHLRILDALGYRSVRLAYRRRSSALTILDWAAQHVPRLAVTIAESLEAAIRGAVVVVTAVTRGAIDARIDASWLERDVLLLPVDFAHCIHGDVAHTAAVLAADHVPTYEDARAHGALPGYPAARHATGDVIDLPRADGVTLIQNLGNAACDLVIAEQVRQGALRQGVGRQLPV